jgi:hypothetical protein
LAYFPFFRAQLPVLSKNSELILNLEIKKFEEGKKTLMIDFSNKNMGSYESKNVTVIKLTYQFK